MKNNSEQGTGTVLSDDDLLALVYENELIIGKIEQQLEEQLRIMSCLGVDDVDLEKVKKAYGYTLNEENKVRQMLKQMEGMGGDTEHENSPIHVGATASNDKVNERVKRKRVRSFI